MFFSNLCLDIFGHLGKKFNKKAEVYKVINWAANYGDK